MGWPTRATRRGKRGSGPGISAVRADEDPPGEAPAEGDPTAVHFDEDRPAPRAEGDGSDPGAGAEAEPPQAQGGPGAAVNLNEDPLRAGGGGR